MPDLAAEDFTPLPLSSTLEHIGTLTTGYELVNRLIENVWWSCRDNFIDVPTDCPQRDERMGWTGDAQSICPPLPGICWIMCRFTQSTRTI